MRMVSAAWRRSPLMAAARRLLFRGAFRIWQCRVGRHRRKPTIARALSITAQMAPSRVVVSVFQLRFLQDMAVADAGNISSVLACASANSGYWFGDSEAGLAVEPPEAPDGGR